MSSLDVHMLTSTSTGRLAALVDAADNVAVFWRLWAFVGEVSDVLSALREAEELKVTKECMAQCSDVVVHACLGPCVNLCHTDCHTTSIWHSGVWHSGLPSLIRHSIHHVQHSAFLTSHSAFWTLPIQSFLMLIYPKHDTKATVNASALRVGKYYSGSRMGNTA